MLIAAIVGTGLLGGTAGAGPAGRRARRGRLVPRAGLVRRSRSGRVIYVAAVAYAVWQALPSQRARERQRAVGWWIAAHHGAERHLARARPVHDARRSPSSAIVVLLVVLVRRPSSQIIRVPGEGCARQRPHRRRDGPAPRLGVARDGREHRRVADDDRSAGSWADAADVWGVVVARRRRGHRCRRSRGRAGGASRPASRWRGDCRGSRSAACRASRRARAIGVTAIIVGGRRDRRCP